MANKISESKIEKARELVASGMTAAGAARELGISAYTVRRHLTKKSKRSKLVAIPQGTGTGNVAMFFGTPEAVAAAARSML